MISPELKELYEHKIKNLEEKLSAVEEENKRLKEGKQP